MPFLVVPALFIDVPGSAANQYRGGSLPSLGVDAHLALTYYYLPNPFCTIQPCQVFVDFASSVNGGKTWSTALTLAGPTSEDWYANTNAGFMTGDYIATGLISNHAIPVVPVARAPHGNLLDEAMYAGSLEVTGGNQPVQVLATPGGPPTKAGLERLTQLRQQAVSACSARLRPQRRCNRRWY